jgi:uncharacterized radical SAM superfamily Fe-S cluster-containing enzyme
MSICPVCNKKVSVEIVNEEDRVYSVKICPEHGVFKSIVWYGEPSYEEWVQCGDNTRPYRINTKEEAGCPYDCGICDAIRVALIVLPIPVTPLQMLRKSLPWRKSGESMPFC